MRGTLYILIRLIFHQVIQCVLGLTLRLIVSVCVCVYVCEPYEIPGSIRIMLPVENHTHGKPFVEHTKQ